MMGKIIRTTNGSIHNLCDICTTCAFLEPPSPQSAENCTYDTIPFPGISFPFPNP